MEFFKRNRKKRGFTLIELVAVVAIIGILAALLVPKISGYITDAKKTKVIDQARQVVTAVETANTKYDTTIPAGTVSSLKGSSNKAAAAAWEYLSNGDTAATAATLFPNLAAGTTIEDCKNIIEYNNFTIDKNTGVVDNVSTS